MSATTKFSQITVGTTAVQVDTTFLQERNTVILQALVANTGKVYIGTDNTVTVSGATGGMELQNFPLDLPLDNSDHVWAIATAAGQGLSIMQIAVGTG